MFMIDYKELGWWYWFTTACLLTAGIAGFKLGFLLAIGLTLFQLLHFIIREQNIVAFPVQVRFWYLILLLVSLPEPVQLLYRLPTVGTWAQLIFGYCTMARCVALFPWNRREKFSVGLLKKTFLSRPVRGNILQGFSTAQINKTVPH